MLYLSAFKLTWDYRVLWWASELQATDIMLWKICSQIVILFWRWRCQYAVQNWPVIKKDSWICAAVVLCVPMAFVTLKNPVLMMLIGWWPSVASSSCNCILRATSTINYEGGKTLRVDLCLEPILSWKYAHGNDIIWWLCTFQKSCKPNKCEAS